MLVKTAMSLEVHRDEKTFAISFTNVLRFAKIFKYHS